MPEHVRANLIFRLSEDTANIKNKFIALEIRLRRALRSETTAKEIIRIITRKDDKFREIFEDCDTIDKLLDEAEQHWSFFDYDLVQLIIGCIFEDEHRLMVRLKAYITDFKDYAKHRVCECPSNVFEDEKKNGKVIVFKIEECNFEAMTVGELKKLCSRLNSAIGSYELRLLKADPGCVQLTFRALPSADEMIQKLTRVEQQALRNMGVLSITYGEQTLNLVSPSEEMVEHEEATKKGTSGILIARGREISSCSALDEKSVLVCAFSYGNSICRQSICMKYLFDVADLTVEVTESEGENSDSSDTSMNSDNPVKNY